MNKILTPRTLFITALILFAVVSRLIPHPMNVAPITAIALFGSALMGNRFLGFVIPLTAMYISDLFIGWHNTMWSVYLSFALIAGIGQLLRGRVKVLSVVVASFSSSVLFFLITNAAVYLVSQGYYNNLMESYIAGIPFFRNSLLGDLFYSGVLFGGFYLAQLKFPKLVEVKS